MKRFISAIALVSMFLISLGQNVYTSDGQIIGDRKELLHECTSNFEDEFVESDGIKIATSTLCSCLIDEVVAKLTLQQLADIAMSDDDAEGEWLLLLMGSHFSELVNCLADDMEYQGAPLNGKEIKENLREVAIRSCVEAMVEDDSFDDTGITEKQANDFCTCAVEKMLAKGYSYEQIMSADDADGPVFNEVVIGCIGVLGDFPELNTSIYNPSDIHGDATSSQVTLLQYANSGHKVKLSICGIDKYFLFDTGATDMIINTEIEKQLIKNGYLSEVNYLGETEYELADGSIAKGKIVVLNNVKIGDYTVDNVIVGVIDGGSLLCGHSLLNKFRKWEVTNGGQMLLLYK